MKKHVKIYLDYFDYTISEYIKCECCNNMPASDIHHIECRGMGGSKEKDNIENLMALCRWCHVDYGDRKEFKEMLKEKHNAKLQTRKGI